MNFNNNQGQGIYFFAGVLFVIAAIYTGNYALILLGAALIIIGGTMGR